MKRRAYVLRNQSIDKFKEIRVEIPSKLLQDEEVKSVMKREEQRFGPILRTGLSIEVAECLVRWHGKADLCFGGAVHSH